MKRINKPESVEPTRRGPGRPKGSRNKRTLLAEAILDEHLAEIARAVAKAAADGDMIAARIVLDRLAPVRKGRPIRFTVGDTTTAAGIASALDDLARAMARGDVTAEEANAAAAVLDRARNGIETHDLERRIQILEQAAAARRERAA